MLLVGGVQLIRRRPSAAYWCVTWSILKMIMTVATAVTTAAMQRDQFEAMGGPSAAMGPMLIVFSFVFGLLWGWALPVFMLVWFSMRWVRQQVADWRETPAA